tara:strand:- start:163 stop:519 length:357 start_codon:yes stop_codon:yes gene_type:complete
MSFNIIDSATLSDATYTCGNLQISLSIEFTDGRLKGQYFDIKAECSASLTEIERATYNDPAAGGELELEGFEVVDFQESDCEGEEVTASVVTIGQLDDYAEEFFEGLESRICEFLEQD